LDLRRLSAFYDSLSFVGYDHFNPAILLASRFGRIGRNRKGFPVASGENAIRANPLRGQKVAHSFGPSLR
jgi:hypothetical protein